MKFTAGPWHIDDDTEDRLTVRAEDNGFIADCDDGHYNDADVYIRSAYAEPNARLIAASPDLLAALQAIDAGFKDGSIAFTRKRRADSEPYHPANTLMCEALAKAVL
jgi:hypothetical protein